LSHVITNLVYFTGMTQIFEYYSFVVRGTRFVRVCQKLSFAPDNITNSRWVWIIS